MHLQQQRSAANQRAGSTTQQQARAGSASHANSKQRATQGGRNLLNRTTQEAQSTSKPLTGSKQQTGQQKAHDRSFNAPLLMRHRSPHTAGHQLSGNNLQMVPPAGNPQFNSVSQNRSRGPSQSKASGSVGPKPSQQSQGVSAGARQYQPSLMFKPGHAKQAFEQIKKGGVRDGSRSGTATEPEIVNYQSAAAQMQAASPGYVNFGQPQNSFQPMYASNPSQMQHQKQPLYDPQTGQPLLPQQRLPQKHPNFNVADNQNPYPRQYETAPRNGPPQAPLQRQAQGPSNQWPQGYYGGSQSPETTKKVPPRPVPQRAYMSQGQGQPPAPPMRQAQPKAVAYDTVPNIPQAYREVFHPPAAYSRQLHEATNADVEAGRYDLPRSEPHHSDERSGGEDDVAIREMENLLAEIGQDVSELKKRPFYQRGLHQQKSEPRSSAKRQSGRTVGAGAKSNSLSPVANSRSRSYHSGSQEGSRSGAADLMHARQLQHRSLSPQSRNQQPQTGTQPGVGSSSAHEQSTSQHQQWASPSNDHKRVVSQAVGPSQTQSALPDSETDGQQLNQVPTPPSHSNTMSLTVSVNPTDQHQHQERLFRLSPLSSKMQEDTDGEEQSNSQRAFFNLNQSINTSQLDSSSPEHRNQQQQLNQVLQQRHQHRQSAEQLASGSVVQSHSRDLLIMREVATESRPVATRTFENDRTVGESSIRAMDPDASPIEHRSEDKSLDGASTDALPILQSSAMTGQSQTARQGTVISRTETPLGLAESQRDILQSSSRAFSRSSNRRLRAGTSQLDYQPEHPHLTRVTLREVETQTEKENEMSKVTFSVRRVETEENATQTARRDFAPVKLTPFDTYDLFFVKDLVNNLNQDNEVLVDSNQDLKYAFHFLMQKHKQLQQELVREQAKNSLFEDTKRRLDEVRRERDAAIEKGLVLGEKVTTMSRVIRLAVDEQAHLEEESEKIQQQLQEENAMLRSLMRISDEHAAPTTQQALLSTVQAMERQQSELAYKEDLRVREAIKNECEAEYESLKKELPDKIEKELSVKFEQQNKELESLYEDKLLKAQEETAILKKTLLEQSLQRLQQIQPGSIDLNSDESGSLEGSGHRLSHYSQNSQSTNPHKKSTQSDSQPNRRVPVHHSKLTGESPDNDFSDEDGAPLGVSNSLSSSSASQHSGTDNPLTSSVVMQQELDEFAQNVYGDLTKEEQELVSQLTAKANADSAPSSSSGAVREEDQLQDVAGYDEPPSEEDYEGEDADRKMALNDLMGGGGKREKEETDLNQGFKRGQEEDLFDEDDDAGYDEYFNDFETFGEEAKSPTEDPDSRGNKLIQVITNTKKATTDQQKAEDGNNREWDFDDKAFSADLFSSQPPPATQSQLMFPEFAGAPQSSNSRDEPLDDGFLTESGASHQMNDAKMSGSQGTNGERQPQNTDNVDLWADFGEQHEGVDGRGQDDRQDQDGSSGKSREELLKEQYDEFFTSDSDQIEEDLVEGDASSDSDSDGGRISPKSFDERFTQEQISKSQQSAEEQKANQGIERSSASPSEDKTSLNNSDGHRHQDQDDPTSGTSPSPQPSKVLSTPSQASSTNPPSQTRQQVSAPHGSQAALYSSSERINKYKRDKRASAEANNLSLKEAASGSEPKGAAPDQTGSSNQAESSSHRRTTSFDQQQKRHELASKEWEKPTQALFEDDDEPIDFNPPQQEVATGVIAQDFAADDDLDDDFLFTAGGVTDSVGASGRYSDETGVAGKDVGSSAQLFDFYDDWDMADGDEGASKPAGTKASLTDDFFGDDAADLGPIGHVSEGKEMRPNGEGMDEEDRRFFEELSKGFTAGPASQEAAAQQDGVERNEMMDDTRATRQMLAQAKAGGQEGEGQLDAIDFDADREESKEDEYDYFLDNQAEENGGNALGYHVIDEGDLQESDEDLEELDEEEKAQRHREMLKDFKERMEKEDKRASSTSPRHIPRPN